MIVEAGSTFSFHPPNFRLDWLGLSNFRFIILHPMVLSPLTSFHPPWPVSFQHRRPSPPRVTFTRAFFSLSPCGHVTYVMYGTYSSGWCAPPFFFSVSVFFRWNADVDLCGRICLLIGVPRPPNPCCSPTLCMRKNVSFISF
jgi:hypothetical protein